MSDLYVPVPGLEEAIDRRNAAAESTPLVPRWLVAVSAALVPLAALGNALLPHPWSHAAGILVVVAALLGGVAMPQLRFERPIIPLALVPAAMSAAGWLGLVAQSLPSPVAQFGCMTVAGVLAALAGKTLPTPNR